MPLPEKTASTLRERVAAAIAEADGFRYEFLDEKTGPSGDHDRELFRALADAALAALGLDDLDAAVERAGRATSEAFGCEWVWEDNADDEMYDADYWLHIGRKAIEAALKGERHG